VWFDLWNIRIFRTSKKLDWIHNKYKIVKRVSSHAYELDLSGRIYPIFHVDLLKPDPANSRLLQVQDDTRPGSILIGKYEEYAVENFLNVYTKGKRKRPKTVVKWTSHAKPTDEPLKFVKDIVAYEKLLRLKEEEGWCHGTSPVVKSVTLNVDTDYDDFTTINRPNS
jgi:hypothetical protein